MKRLLIRADDLGYSEGINYGIAKTVKHGLVKSIGIMTNMPYAEHGISLLEGEKLCYGLHANICVGKPLSNPKLIPSLLNEKGEFKSSREYRNSNSDFIVLEEVILEIEAQYNHFIKLMGKKPSYIDGHAILNKSFFKGLEIVADTYRLKYSGVSIDEKPIKIGKTLVYFHMESMSLDYNPFDEIKKTVKNAHIDACDMFICHPGYLDDYILTTSSLTIPRTKEVEMLCSEDLKRWLGEQSILMVTYDDL